MCCETPTTFAESCALSCGASAGAIACAGNTGPNECPAGTLCCGSLVVKGGTAPACTTQSLSTACQATCADAAPVVGQTCGTAAAPKAYTLRMCTAKADCAGDTGATNCCSFGGSPLAWCVNGADAAASGARCL
jgi:hypothetical protein